MNGADVLLEAPVRSRLGDRLWILPLIGVVAYPGFLLLFDAALNSFRASGNVAIALSAVLAMLLAGSVPILAIRALLATRYDSGPVRVRGVLYLIVAAPSLFSLSLTLVRMAGLRQTLVFIAIWVAAWLAIGLMLYVRSERSAPSAHGQVTRLRVVHGVAALCLLAGFLLTHLANHTLALSSVELHDTVLTWLRGWYRSAWIEPVLLSLLLVMIGTGVPLVLHHSRGRMDAFRVIQAATGAYVGVFICSHVIAVLNGRRLGVETDWFFAAGPNSLLDGSPLLSRLIPHYAFGTFCLILHVACGLRVVLLQHGAPKVLGNRAVYGLASVGLLVTVVIAAALLGIHFD